MAKRRRLTPARLTPDLPQDAQPGTARPGHVQPGPPDAEAGPGTGPVELETKALFPGYPDGVWTPPQRAAETPARRRPPIAGVAGEAAAVAALDEMGRGLEAARQEGRLLLRLPLDQIDAAYLVRDRIALDPEEMAALVDSLRRRGQQTAIEVVDLGPDNPGGRWGLISGWRRLTALRRIAAQDAARRAEDGSSDDGASEEGGILAVVRQREGAAQAYLAMVEENEVRAGLSHYERARIVARAADVGAYPDDRTALAALFAAASRPKRSKIGSFLRLVRALDGDLRHPAAISERLGLALVQWLDRDPRALPALRGALDLPDPAPEVEIAALEKSLRQASAADRPVKPEPPDTDPENTSRTLAQTRIAPGLTCQETDDGLLLTGPALADAAGRAALRQKLAALLDETR